MTHATLKHRNRASRTLPLCVCVYVCVCECVWVCVFMYVLVHVCEQYIQYECMRVCECVLVHVCVQYVCVCVARVLGN